MFRIMLLKLSAPSGGKNDGNSKKNGLRIEAVSIGNSQKDAVKHEIVTELYLKYIYFRLTSGKLYAKIAQRYVKHICFT